jgi:UDP-N-acetylglucosamine:LPS N-acetylglucosamine transferase
MKKVIAIASSGGHWIQLLRLRAAFEGCDVTFVTTMKEQVEGIHDQKIHIVPDASRSQKFRLLFLLGKLLFILLKIRPDVIITTGAAPGLVALRIGKLMGVRTIWIDSIANAEELSLSGRLAVGHGTLVLTQWPEVAEKHTGVEYRGAVL